MFSDALEEYLARHAPDKITGAMNHACAGIGEGEDSFVSFAARRVLEKERVVISHGEIWWADLPEPTGSGPGFRRPVIVVSSDALNRSRIATVVCVPSTSNPK